jgi:hypothetical protein
MAGTAFLFGGVSQIQNFGTTDTQLSPGLHLSKLRGGGLSKAFDGMLVLVMLAN